MQDAPPSDAGPRLAAAVVAACAVLAIAGKLADAAALVWIFKPLTTLAIIAVAARGGRSPYRRAIVAGLACSLAGDVLLIPEGLFVAGLVAFLVAHLAYLFAFTRHVRPFARRAPFAAVAMVAAGVLWVLWPGLPDALKGPVLAYVAMLGAMTAQAVARARVLRDAHARRAAAGGALFLVSDALLALDRFHAPLPLAALWILATYWTAQWLIARSIPPGDAA